CILDMMKTEETAEMHDLAFLLLVYPLSELQGALDSAYYHAESSIKLTDGKEVKSLLQMLLLHAVPEPVISDKKALDISRQILKTYLRKRSKNVITDDVITCSSRTSHF